MIALGKYGAEFGLDLPHRVVAFLAQLMHESGSFKYDREIWGPTPAQERYDTRTDLGNTPAKDGDGYKNRGRGPIQVTGGYNIRAFYEWCKRKGLNPPDFVANPDLITDPWEGLSAIWYWDDGNPDRKSLTFPFRITHVLTDRGSCFTADAFEEACAKLKVIRRTTKPYTPQTNGMVERFNGRVASEVIGINVANRAYNRRRQRVLQGSSPHQKVEERIAQAPVLANPLYKPKAPDDLMAKVDDVLYYANDVSQLDS